MAEAYHEVPNRLQKPFEIIGDSLQVSKDLASSTIGGVPSFPEAFVVRSCGNLKNRRLNGCPRQGQSNTWMGGHQREPTPKEMIDSLLSSFRGLPVGSPRIVSCDRFRRRFDHAFGMPLGHFAQAIEQLLNAVAHFSGQFVLHPVHFSQNWIAVHFLFSQQFLRRAYLWSKQSFLLVQFPQLMEGKRVRNVLEVPHT